MAAMNNCGLKGHTFDNRQKTETRNKYLVVETAWQVQRYIWSTSVVLFNDSDNGQVNKGANNSPETAEEEVTAAAEAEAETAQQRLAKLASGVVKELRKGIDVGSIAAARAQAIRR